MITYFIRVGCQWVKVTTSRAIWARLPHVVGQIGCKATPLALAALLGTPAPANLPPVLRRPIAPPPVGALPPAGALPLAGIPDGLLPPPNTSASDVPLGCCVGALSSFPIAAGPFASNGTAPDTVASTASAPSPTATAPSSGTGSNPGTPISSTTTPTGTSTTGVPSGSGQTQTAVVDEPPTFAMFTGAVLLVWLLSRQGGRDSAKSNT